jgi:hypothetical protein
MDRTRTSNAIVALIAIAGMLGLASCGEAASEEFGTSTQQLIGTIPDDTGAELPDVVAVDESGTSYLFETEEDGTFRLALPSGHTYELFLSEQGTRGLEQASQIVFPRADGDVDRSVSVGGEMAPFDLGEVRPAGTLETANYQVEDASSEDRRQDNQEHAEGADQNGATPDEDGDEAGQDGDEAEADEADAMDCADGPAGLFCVHDGIHPGCEGLAIAADMRAQGRANADQGRDEADQRRDEVDDGRQIAEQARRDVHSADAGAEQADDYLSEDLPQQAGGQLQEDQGADDLDRPIALPQFNPPVEFPGCGVQ